MAGKWVNRPSRGPPPPLCGDEDGSLTIQQRLRAADMHVPLASSHRPDLFLDTPLDDAVAVAHFTCRPLLD